MRFCDERHGFIEHGRKRATKQPGMAQHAADGRARKQLERHHRRDRVAGQPEPRHAVERPEAERRAGPHAHAPEPEVGT
jgi:hypothetical protein